MIPLTVFCAVLAAGIAFLIFGPQGWRTALMHGAVVVLGSVGMILDGLGALDWRSVFDPSTAAAIILAISILGLIYRMATKAPVGEQSPPAPPSA